MMTTLAPDSATPPARISDGQEHRPVLLIVDDEEGPRQSLRIIFKDEYDVLLAENGHTALDLAGRRKIDAAILDIRMPGMSGIEVLMHLKESNPAVEVIMLTAYETVETARQALRHGACDYLSKPFDLKVIRSAVARAMERRALTEEIAANNKKLLELREEIHQQRMADEISRTKGEIYASILHDINSPLTVICGFIELMNETISFSHYLDEEKVEQLRGHLLQTNRQVTKCVEISRRYLGFLRKTATENPTVNAGQILTDLAELLKVHPAARGHQLIFRPLRDEVNALINGTDLIQILLNLAVNAFQCVAAPHRVEIFAQCLPQPLDLANLADGPTQRLVNREGFSNQAPLLAISVRDDGPGIAPEVMPRIFDSYFTTKSPGQGTGLGLSIVQRFVKEVHGAIQIYSRPGQGATFTVYIPAQVPAPYSIAP